MVSISPQMTFYNRSYFYWPLNFGKNAQVWMTCLKRRGSVDMFTLGLKITFPSKIFARSTKLLFFFFFSGMYAHINMFMFLFIQYKYTKYIIYVWLCMIIIYIYTWLYIYIYIAIQIDLCRTFFGRYSNSTCFEHITCPVSAVLHGGWSHYFWWLKFEDLVDVYWF